MKEVGRTRFVRAALRVSMTVALAWSFAFGASAQADLDAGVADGGPPPDEAPDAASPSPPTVTTPPRLLESPEPTYPAEHATIDIAPVVALHATVELDGTVGDAHVEHPGDVEFDAAALEAVRRWRFEPAQRDGEPVRSRVRVEVRFTAAGAHGEGEHGHVDADEHADEHEHADADADEHEHEHADEHADPDEHLDDAAPALREPDDSRFHARASADAIRESREPRAASDVRIDRDVLEAAPHQDAAAMLATAPGVYVARPEGDAVAQQIFLRGFDAEHGQDIEMTLGGTMPLNLPSHVHGQGYADLGFIVPEVVRALRVTEGVYDPHQGDFATAGTIDFDLGVARRGIQARTSYGSFDTFRAVLIWAPEGEREESFGTATYRQTSGFGANRAGRSGGALVQWALGEGAVRGRVHGSIWAARTSIAGYLRRDDVDAGLVDFLGVYDDPSAKAQSALAARAHVGGVLELRGSDGAFTELAAHVLWADFRLQANYTGYLERSQIDADWVGRGDLVEQTNETLGLGLRARHRTRRFAPFDWLQGFVEAGVTARVDSVSQAQNLLAVPQNETWDRRVDADVRAVDVGAFLDLDWSITDYVRVRGGARADMLFYDVDDRLANFIPDERPEGYVVGYRRSALGVAAGPRVTIEARPITPLTLSVAYGEGYRSPQARQLQDGESAPFAKVRSGDAGFRLRLGERDEYAVQGAAYLTHVDSDTAFDPGEGRLEPIGPTTRIGGALHATARPHRIVLASASVTYVHATLDAPPAPTLEDPRPPYEKGQALPFVPPWVVRADVSLNERLFDLGDEPLTGRIGVGFSFLSSRPLPFDLAADSVALLDASASVRWTALELGVEIFNLLDTRYAAVEQSYASYWDTTSIPSRLPARHFAAGSPLSVQVTLGVQL